MPRRVISRGNHVIGNRPFADMLAVLGKRHPLQKLHTNQTFTTRPTLSRHRRTEYAKKKKNLNNNLPPMHTVSSGCTPIGNVTTSPHHNHSYITIASTGQPIAHAPRIRNLLNAPNPPTTQPVLSGSQMHCATRPNSFIRCRVELGYQLTLSEKS